MFNRALLELCAKKPHYIIAIALSSLLGAISVYLWCFSLAQIIDRVFLHNLAPSHLYRLLCALALALLVRLVCTIIADESALRLSRSLRAAISERLVAHSERLGSLWLQNEEHSGELHNLITEGVDTLDGYFATFLPLFLKCIVYPPVFLRFVFPIDSISGLIMLITAPLTVVFMILIGRFSALGAKRGWQSLAQISAYLQDVILGLSTLKVLGRAAGQTEKIRQISDRFRRDNLNILKIAFLSAFTMELLSTVSIAMIAVGLGIRLIEGTVSFASALFIIFLAPEFYLPLRNLGSQFHTAMNAAEAINRMEDFCAHTPPKMPNIAAGDADTGLVMEQVSYHYAGGFGVSEIDLVVPPRQITVLFGPSGGGKTTLLNLACGLLVPKTGSVRLHGQAVVAAQALRTQITYIPQRPHIFAMSLLDNLRLYTPTLSRAETIATARAYGLDTLAQSLPLGYDTPLGEGGRVLSGGQKQLIAIVRAALKESELVIFDELSQGLDLAGEQQILQALTLLAHDKTLLLAAHRKNCLLFADYAIKVEQGKIVYMGAVAELACHNSDFADYLKGAACHG